MKLGDRIKELRLKNNMKQSELGNALHVSGATISSWEVGRTEPRMGMIEEMCDLFHCSKSDILDYYIEAEKPSIQHIIDRISAFISYTSPSYNSFFSNFTKDSDFMEHIKILFALSPDRKNRVYEYIEDQYYRSETEQKKDGVSVS